MKPLPAVVAGHICVDVIPKFDHLAPGAFLQLMQPGRLITAGPATFSTGGAVSNVGLSLHRLGVPTRLVARVGNDPFAQVVRDIVDSYDPGMSAGIAGSDTATSYTLILNPPGVDRIFLHHPGSNDAFGAGDVNYEMVADAALFHFGYPPMMQQLYRNGGAELVAMMRKVKETGATTSLDMVFPDPTAPGGQADWRSILAQTLPYVDIFVPSIEEMLFMLRRATYEQMQLKRPEAACWTWSRPSCCQTLRRRCWITASRSWPLSWASGACTCAPPARMLCAPLAVPRPPVRMDGRNVSFGCLRSGSRSWEPPAPAMPPSPGC
jgi:sugar/nucleoside kinase (ribokinase family)